MEASQVKRLSVATRRDCTRIARNGHGPPWTGPHVTGDHRTVLGLGQGTFPLDAFGTDAAFKVEKKDQEQHLLTQAAASGAPGNGRPRDHFQEDVHNGGAHNSARKIGVTQGHRQQPKPHTPGNFP